MNVIKDELDHFDENLAKILQIFLSKRLEPDQDDKNGLVLMI